MSFNKNQVVKIAVIGDIHNQWEAEDEATLRALGVDLVLFVGDFGNEAVHVVEAVAAVTLPKAVVFGNHDAWYSMTDWGRRKAPYDRTQENRVQRQLDLVGEAHVGYGKRDFPEFGLSVVGSRPFTWGGTHWRDRGFYREKFGIDSFAESADCIAEAAKSATQETLIFMGHNGPFGLGDAPEDMCGRDWKPSGGDYGDPDFAEAIDRTRILGKNIPLVTFGHMHHQLKHTRERLRTVLKQDATGTIYFNAARVPRIIEVDCKKQRNFSIVLLEEGQVIRASLIWVGEEYQLLSEEVFYDDQPVKNLLK
ncbi:MAG: TIGR04168 family protein [Microcoleaceae cyanobacterium]